MDPLTQGALGAATVLAVANPKHLRWAFPLSFLAAGAPDLDIFTFIRGDEIGTLLLHRQFTHSLAFIPVGGALCAAAFYGIAKLIKRPIPFKPALIYATLAYATHGLLDACTSYGTFLSWPFSNVRTSWDAISIIDPAYTIPLLIGGILSAIQKTTLAARFGFVAASLYLALGFYQHHNAQQAQHTLAQSRGHTIEHGRTMPTFANLTSWRSVYRAGGTLYADELTVLPIRGTRIRQGESVAAAPYQTIAPQGSQLNTDILRYANFADTLLYHPGGNSSTLADARYSRDPAAFTQMWAIHFNPQNPGQPATRSGL